MRTNLTLMAILLFGLHAHAKIGESSKDETKGLAIEMPVIKTSGIRSSIIEMPMLKTPSIQTSTILRSNADLLELIHLNETSTLKIHPKKFAILYKMKENIIRRELSFIPGKKWRKWA